MIHANGGRVTKCLTSLTDALIVGDDPGYCKVSTARRKKVPMISISDLRRGIEGDCMRDVLAAANAEPMVIENFSSGYEGNSVAKRASPEDLAAARGQNSKGLEGRDHEKSTAVTVVTPPRPEHEYDASTCTIPTIAIPDPSTSDCPGQRPLKKKKKTNTTKKLLEMLDRIFEE